MILDSNRSKIIVIKSHSLEQEFLRKEVATFNIPLEMGLG